MYLKTIILLYFLLCSRLPEPKIGIVGQYTSKFITIYSEEKGRIVEKKFIIGSGGDTLGDYQKYRVYYYSNNDTFLSLKVVKYDSLLWK